MTKDKTYDPFEGFKQISELWEKQLNGLLYMLTDNEEFVRSAKFGLDTHSRYMELVRKNQELLASTMNIPTKSDVANVANLSIQAEAKIDTLEEQIWNLQDSIASLNRENISMFQEVVTAVKQIKTEFQKAAQELAEAKNQSKDLQELKQAIVEIRIMQVNLQELRKEFEGMREFQEKMEASDTNETNLVHQEIQTIKQGLAQLTDVKKEISSLKNWMKKEKEKEKEKELVLSGDGPSK